MSNETTFHWKEWKHENETVFEATAGEKIAFFATKPKVESFQYGEIHRCMAMVWADGRVHVYVEPEVIEEQIKELGDTHSLQLYPFLEIAKLRRQLGIPLDVQEPIASQFTYHESSQL